MNIALRARVYWTPAKREPKDADMRNATIALERAARHARELAERTGTPCWVMRDGRIVDAVTGKEAVAAHR